MSKCYDNPEYDKIDDNLQNTWKQSKYIEPKQEGYICPHTKIQCDDECCVSAEDCHITSSLASGIVDCEEPKQEILPEFSLSKDIFDKISDLPKQETLEEQMYRASFANESPLWHDGFIAGSNYQAERMYSEEDVFSIIDKAFHMYASSHRHDAKEWFEKFKKK